MALFADRIMLVVGGARGMGRATALALAHRLAVPEDMASAAVWLLSDSAAYVTGQSIVVDGGLMTGVPSS